MKPPVPPIESNTRTEHGKTVNDPFRWLEDKEHPQTIPYLEAENTYTKEATQQFEALEKKLVQELLNRTPDHDQTAPYTVGSWSRFASITKEQSYWVYKRAPLDQNNQPDLSKTEILLDENKRAQEHDYYHLDSLQLNPSQTKMAWLEDTQGNERFTLYIQEITSKQTIVIPHANIKWSLAWLDNRRLVYVGGDDADRPSEIRVFDCLSQTDQCIWHEKDERFHLAVHRARVGNLVVCEAHSKTTSEARLLRWSENTVSLQTVQHRQKGIKYTVEVGEQEVFLRTNVHHPEFSVDIRPIYGNQSQKLLTFAKGTTLESIDLFTDYLICWLRRNGLQEIDVCHISTGEITTLSFPDPTYEIYADINPHFNSRQFRLRYTSPVQPDIVLSYDLPTGQGVCIHQFNIPNYQPSLYRCHRIWAESSDGVTIPISLMEPKSIKDSAPLLMVGYGAYGVSYNAGFYSTWVSLLDRGFRVAIAHVRGGGELGRQWYNHGKGPHKPNSFSDFIACAEHLIHQEYTSKDQLVISGGSAGGLLVATCLNLRPDLFAGCVAEVPFVDVTTTMLNPDLPLTIIEYEEWGNPNEVQAYNLITSYDPYRNYSGQQYPPTLITAGLHDPRVGYWEPAKWVAKIRTLLPTSNQILLKTNMQAGHGGDSGRLEMVKEDASIYAFIINCLQTTLTEK
mgnify:CR=1 FL=1